MPDAFGMGYEEVDANGNPVPGTFQDVAPFDPARPTVCVPLGPGNTPTVERWQLVNLAKVYHCHILEHEDGGMMARIRVRASPN
jgi:hypothetical protein